MTQSSEGAPAEPVRHEPARAEAAHQAELQACVDRVAATHAGQSVQDIKAALDAELTRAGHPGQPAPWLEAVAEETAAGHRYVLGTTVQPRDTRSATPPTEAELTQERREGERADPAHGTS